MSVIALLIDLLMGKGGYQVMAIIFAGRIINGKQDFTGVPSKLRTQVAKVLIEDCGLPELVPVEYGGTLAAE